MSAPADRTTLLATADALHASALACGLSVRGLPQAPTSCCGRGCQACVWEAYDAAIRFWCEDVNVLLEERYRLHAATAPACKGKSAPRRDSKRESGPAL